MSGLFFSEQGPGLVDNAMMSPTTLWSKTFGTSFITYQIEYTFYLHTPDPLPIDTISLVQTFLLDFNYLLSGGVYPLPHNFISYAISFVNFIISTTNNNNNNNNNLH